MRKRIFIKDTKYEVGVGEGRLFTRSSTSRLLCMRDCSALLSMSQLLSGREKVGGGGAKIEKSGCYNGSGVYAHLYSHRPRCCSPYVTINKKLFC